MRSLIVLLLCASGLFGQTDSVLVTDERLVTLPASEVVFTVTVGAPAYRSLSDVVDALNGTQIGVKDLTARVAGRSYAVVPYSQRFQFRVTQPADRYYETAHRLQIASAGPSGLTISFGANTQLSAVDIEAARAAALPELFRDTKARAERVLIEAGYRPGPIVELNESIDPLPGSHRVRLSLGLRMARLDARAGPLECRISTVVTPPAGPYRVAGAPVLKVSVRAVSQTRAEVLKLVAPAGLTEAHLTGVASGPDRFSRDVGREPGPPTFTYTFTAPIAEADIRTRLDRLESYDIDAGVTFPFLGTPVDPAGLASLARGRAGLLAGLLGGQLGESLGAADRASASVVVVSGRRVGDFTAGLEVRLPEPPPPPASLRYQFAALLER